jgi:methionyl-tRNA synthetase
MKSEITYNEFTRLDMRVAKVIMAEEVEDADRLIKVTLDVGPMGERVVAAAIKEWYSPEDLAGKMVVYLANLKPRRLRGVLSQGMIIAAGTDVAVLLTPDGDSKPGDVVR